MPSSSLAKVEVEVEVGVELEVGIEVEVGVEIEVEVDFETNFSVGVGGLVGGWLAEENRIKGHL